MSSQAFAASAIASSTVSLTVSVKLFSSGAVGAGTVSDVVSSATSEIVSDAGWTAAVTVMFCPAAGAPCSVTAVSFF